jgi:hypothetical protein
MIKPESLGFAFLCTGILKAYLQFPFVQMPEGKFINKFNKTGNVRTKQY